MDCNKIKTHLIDYLDDNLDQRTRVAVEKHIGNCNDCKEELQELKTVFKAIDQEPEQLPDASLKIDFNKMLNKEKELLKDSKVVSLNNNKPANSIKTYLQIAATIALVITAYFYGKNENNTILSKEVATLQKEKMDMKETMTISLIDNESASKRLLAVNYAEEFEKPGNEILNALINKMYYDNHINVRLAAAEALAKFADTKMVRDALIQALEIEQDPGMQIELIQILVSIQEKRAVPTMEKLLRNEATPNYVKDQVKVGLPSLI